MKLRTRLATAVMAAAALVCPFLASPAGALTAPIAPEPTAPTKPAPTTTTPPDPRYCVLLPFDSAAVVTDRITRRPTLVVTGQAPYGGMDISLEPLIYIRQPEYWGIQVVGCLQGAGLTVITPYKVSLDITGVTGTIGVEVIGRDRTQRIVVCNPKVRYCWRGPVI